MPDMLERHGRDGGAVVALRTVPVKVTMAPSRCGRP